MPAHPFGRLLPAVLTTLLSTAACGQEMTFPGANWETALPESQGVDAEGLASAVEFLQQNSGHDGVDQLVVIRRGRIIWQGSKIDEVHGIWSCTKSFTSTVLGLLVDDRKCSLATIAGEYVPELAETYPEVCLRHFATMTSGYRAVGDEPRGSYSHGPSLTPFQPDSKRLFAPPGSHYAYWDSAMNQFANVLTRIADRPLADEFRQRIAAPIGMKPGQWKWGDFGEVEGLTVNGGAGNAGKYVQISARELARFGHLFLNDGAWNGRQLISADWIEAATSVQVPVSTPLGNAQLSDIRGAGVYGLNWWTNGLQADGKRKWPGAPADSFAASGFNNNDMFVIPSWQIVVVRLGLDEGDFPITDTIYGSFLEQIGTALIEPAIE